MNGFSLNIRDKFFNVLNYLLYFVLFWLAIVSTFLAFWINRKLAHFFLDNWSVKIRGLFAHCLINFIRFLLLGAVHSLLRSSSIQLPLLLGIEGLYVFFLVFFSAFWKTHLVVYKIWFTVFFSFLRMVLQIALIIQQKTGIVRTGSEEEYLI